MLVSERHKALILRLKDPARVTNVLNSAKTLEHEGQTLVIAPHRMGEYKLLLNLGLNPPHPMDYYYDWPGRYQPMNAQRETARFLATHSRAYCLDDLGTGKTMATLWAFDFLREQGLAKKALVVAPLSTLERTWADHIWEHFPHLEHAVLHGPAERRRELLQRDAHLYVINHDGVKILLQDLVKRTDIDTIIIDELSQVARNAQTGRWKVLKDLVAKRERVWGLTGTPVPNEPTDAWAQCRLLTPSTVPPFYTHFRDLTMRQLGQFKWVPRDNALDTVHRAMQPAIRHKRDECIDLPPCVVETREAPLTKDQSIVYKAMWDHLYAEYAGGEITAANEAVKAMRLVQICCIMYNTPVLTRAGWKAIQLVTDEDEVWDGEDWVRQDGAVLMGYKPTVECYGVRMTLDHKVMTVAGWKTAEEVLHVPRSKRPDRATVRLPDGYFPCGDKQIQLRYVALSMRLRESGGSSESVPTSRAPCSSTELRLPSRQRDPQNGGHASIQQLPQYVAQVLFAKGQGLSQLWSAWRNSLRTLAGSIQKLLGGHGTNTPAWANAGSHRQQRPILARKLPLEHRAGAVEQQAYQHDYRYTAGAHEYFQSGESGWPSHRNRPQAHTHIRVDNRKGADNSEPAVEVYDLINCGPRNRFTVLGADGTPLIVHNCGAANGDDGVVFIPPRPRINVLLETIEEAASKTIVFVPFKSALKMVHAEVSRHYSAEMIYGEVGKSERDRILAAFQKSTHPQVLVAQPGTMSHGLTLTAASVIVWFAPITSAEIYEQANARITRPGQRHSQLIIRIQGSPLEARMYNRLHNKLSMQGTLLAMFKEKT